MNRPQPTLPRPTRPHPTRGTGCRGHRHLTWMTALPVIFLVGVGWLEMRAESPWLLFLVCTAVGVMAAALLTRGPVLNLDLEATMPARAVVGRPVTQGWKVTNRGTSPTAPMLLLHQLSGFPPVRVYVPQLAPGAAATVEVERTPVCRASGESTQVLVFHGGPFAFFVRSTHHPLPARTCLVHPQTVDVALPGPRTAADDDPSGNGRTRAGVDVYGVREWRPGDVARDVHWRASARRGRLAVVERERPERPALAVLLVGTAGAAAWEPAVAVGASAAALAAGQGRRTALVASQSGVAPLVTGGPTTLLDWSAALADARLPTPAELSAALSWLGRGGDLLVVAADPLADAWWAGARKAAGAAGVRIGPLAVDGALAGGVNAS